MVILTKRKFMFRNADGECFISKGGMVIENAPDWIPSTRIYNLALADGDIVEVKGNTQKAETAAVDKATETKETETVEAAEETETVEAAEEPEAEEPETEEAKPKGRAGKKAKAE